MISKKSLLSAALSAMLVATLCGCFLTLESTTPLLTGATADFPFRSMIVEFPEGQVPVVREGDTYVINDPNKGRLDLLLKKVGDDTYIVQATGKGQRRAWPNISYGFIKQQQSDLHGLWCGSWSVATLQSVGIVVLKDNLFPLCDFNRLDQLVSLIAKRPDGKWPEVKLRIVSIEK